MKVHVTFAGSDAQSFFSCLGIGVLKCIRDGVAHPATGIWTLGRPIIWETLQEYNLLDDQALHTLQSFDEINALVKLLPEQFYPFIDQLMSELESSVQETQFSGWNIRIEITE
jgi:hypothetical protein